MRTISPGRCFALAMISLTGAVALGACGQPRSGSTAAPPTPQQAQGLPRDQQLAAVPIGDLAGAAQSNVADTITNPYAQDPRAIKEGQTLFIKMNCAGCHGFDAKGGMGPSLTDHYWRYGGVPAMVFKSIYEGRPQGMPAWGQALPPQEIWKIVAYIDSLGGMFPASQFHAALQGDLGNDDGSGKEKAQEPNVTAPQQ